MRHIADVISDRVGEDLWTYLSHAEKPILMYGMGNGADKILNVLSAYGVEIDDFFASDGFVRGHSFHGKVVLSYSDAIKKHGEDVIILVSFGSHLPEVVQRIFALTERHEVYIPDVPVCGGSHVFTMEFFREHAEEFNRAYRSMADEESLLCFENILLYKLTGKPCYLKQAESDEAEILTSLLSRPYTSYMDLGAYNGDTLAYYLSRYPSIRRVYAMEPDGRNYRKLTAAVEAYPDHQITAVQAAAWDKDEELTFTASGNRNSSGAADGTLHGAKIVTVPGMRPDALASEAVDFIKYDVEGAELEALRGSREIILRDAPDLLVSAYHRSEDLFRLPAEILELCPEYRLYLRRLPCFPAWDINLYALKR
ncbi:MAG: FkbM family methyltransferase [Clostridia bacterium]|nr:FkbM family methyltransferase [Clostridia bacterium]